MDLITTKDVCRILSHYDVTPSALTKWADPKLGLIVPAKKTGTGPATRLYFSLPGDVVKIAFFKLLLNLGFERIHAAHYLDPSNKDGIDQKVKAGQVFFNIQKIAPYHPMFGRGAKSFGFADKPHSKVGEGTILTCSINIKAIELEVVEFAKRLRIGGPGPW